MNIYIQLSNGRNSGKLTVGACYIISTIVVSPKIGLVMFLALVIFGQMVMSLAMDHVGMFGLEQKPFTWWKGVGLLLILSGVVLLKK